LNSDIDYESEFDNLVNSKRIGETVKKQFSEIRDKYLEEKGKEFDSQLEISKHHDKLIDICMSAFGPRSKCYEKSEYKFVSTEPLIEKTFAEEGVKNFDVLIINSNQKIAIFVECKTSISRPGKIISDIYSSVNSCREYKEYLEDKIGNEIDFMEFVVCVPAGEVDHLVREIEKRENSGQINAKTDILLKVWQIDVFMEQKLQLFTRIKSRNDEFLSQHRDKNLTKVLAEGTKVDRSEVFVRVHPSSHPLVKGRWAITEIFSINQNKNPEDRVFTRNHIKHFFQSKGTISHYSPDIISDNVTEHFIGESLAYNIIERLPEKPDYYRLKLEGKKLKTVLSNYERVYRKGFLDRIATKLAKKDIVDKFRTRHPDVTKFKNQK